MTEPLCGDPTCESYGCTREAIDAYNERVWHDAGRAVAEMTGLTYDEASGFRA